MRSIKSELYLFLKTIILGGEYTDSQPVTYDFAGISYNDNGKNITCKNFMFYNSLKNEYPFLSVLFRFENIEPNLHYLMTGPTSQVGTIKEKVRFSLFVPYPKITADTLDEDYLDHLDICEKIHYAVSHQRFLGVQTIIKVGETSDDDSRVIMGKEMIYETVVEIAGSTENVDANDPNVNPEAPVNVEVSAVIVKKVS